MTKSTDMIATDAIAQIKNFKKVGEIRDFVKGDKRKTILEAVDVSVDKIKNKKSFWPFNKKESKKEEEPKEKKVTPSR